MEVHICINGNATLSEAHRLSVKIEKELESAIPGIVSIIHVEDQDWCKKSMTKDGKDSGSA
jgi:divalent metal cation (Fe/Co/Zn/Cd) transporter